MDAAIGLLFAFGVCCLGIELAGSWKVDRVLSVLLWHMRGKGNASAPTGRVVRPAVDEESGAAASGDNGYNYNDVVDDDEESDVASERRRIGRLTDEEVADPARALLIRNLRREFVVDDGAPLVAVDCLSLELHYGEVFGLLGPNGAGKMLCL